MDRNTTIEAHYRKNYRQLVKRVLNRVPNHSHALAEEVVQEAYVRAMQYWRSYNPARGDFDRWFNLILRNAVADCINSESGGPLSLDDDDRDIKPFVMFEDHSIPKAVALKVQDGINAQRPEIADILNMFFNLGMRTVDIEKCSELSHTNIRQIIRRFRIKWENENTFSSV